jgi:hypothetical protein
MSKNKSGKSIKHDKITNKRIMHIIQDLIQIEDRLFQFERRCYDCIKEKCLKVEATVDSLLQSEHKKDEFLYPILKDLPNSLRKLQRKMVKCKCDKKFCKMSQDIRKIRKDLIHNYYNADKEITYEKLKKMINHKCPRKIMPVLNPTFNIREVVKNILLLEDHLLDPDRRCYDCIMKHSMIIEGFLEEAVTIDKKQKYIKLLKPLPKKMRNIQAMIVIGREKYADIAKELRKIRKPLMKIAFEFVVECCGKKIN